MALTTRDSANSNPRSAVSLSRQLELSDNQALPLPPISLHKVLGPTASSFNQVADLLHALKRFYARGTLPADYYSNNASPPDLVRFNIGTCTLTQLRDYIKQLQDLDFYSWFENRLQ